MNNNPEKIRGERSFLKNTAPEVCIEFTPKTSIKTVAKEEYENGKPWGLLTSIDLDDCDPEIITNAEKVKQHVHELCKHIDMKRFGETQVVYFGDDPKVAGFSMTQLIETSLVSAHYGSGTTKYVYLDIFSCKWYDQEKAFEFTKNFFKAKKAKFSVVLRGKGIA